MREMSKKFRSKELTIFLAIFVLLSDQLSKLFVVANLGLGDSFEVLPFFNIVRVENTGITFGILKNIAPQFLLIAVSFATIIALLFWIRRNPNFLLPIGVVIAGALGNIVDRMMRGAVIDFLDFHVYGYHWPAFNIADSAIVIGVFALLIISYGENS